MHSSFLFASSCLSYCDRVRWWGRPNPSSSIGPPPAMDKQGAMSTSGKASGLKPPSKIVRPSGVPSRTSPSSGKKLLKKKKPLKIVSVY